MEPINPTANYMASHALRKVDNEAVDTYNNIGSAGDSGDQYSSLAKDAADRTNQIKAEEGIRTAELQNSVTFWNKFITGVQFTEQLANV